MIKFRWYYDKDYEEAFLNDMGARGYAMTGFFAGIHWFEKCEPGEYTYRVDITNDKDTHQKSEFYDLICDTGGELIATWGMWAFFRKKGAFELYTDNESRILRYRRILRTFLILAIAEFIMFLAQWSAYLNYHTNISLFFSIILSVIYIAFFYQVYKCKRKIASLKRESL